MAQWVKVLREQVQYSQVPCAEATLKERTDSWKLAPALHMRMLTYPQTHENKEFTLRQSVIDFISKMKHRLWKTLTYLFTA